MRKQLAEKQATIERQKAEMETLIATYSTSRSMIVETTQCHSPSSASPDSPGGDLRSEMEKEFKVRHLGYCSPGIRNEMSCRLKCSC